MVLGDLDRGFFVVMSGIHVCTWRLYGMAMAWRGRIWMDGWDAYTDIGR